MTVPGVRIPPSPPFCQCKLPHSPDERRNSFWFQKGLAGATVLLRLAQGRKSVSKALPSHSDRTWLKSLRSKNTIIYQLFKDSAEPYWFAMVLSPSVGLEPAVRVLARSTAGTYMPPVQAANAGGGVDGVRLDSGKFLEVEEDILRSPFTGRSSRCLLRTFLSRFPFCIGMAIRQFP